MLGSEVMMLLDLMLGSDGEEVGRVSNFGADFKDDWVEAHRTARDILEGVQRRQNKYYYLGKRTTIYELQTYQIHPRNTGIKHSSVTALHTVNNTVAKGFN